jgi:hypothetical protein
MSLLRRPNTGLAHLILIALMTPVASYLVKVIKVIVTVILQEHPMFGAAVAQAV